MAKQCDVTASPARSSGVRHNGDLHSRRVNINLQGGNEFSHYEIISIIMSETQLLFKRRAKGRGKDNRQIRAKEPLNKSGPK